MEGPKLELLKQIVNDFTNNPSILHKPSLAFFKTFLVNLGAAIPGSSYEAEEDEIVESDLELDESDVITADNDPPLKMVDTSVEVTEEKVYAAQKLKTKAMSEISEGLFNEAIQHLTEALKLYPTSAILYASRASVFIFMGKPNAAIRDATAAIEVNPESARGFKYRGIARTYLGLWEDAAKDLQRAADLDIDDEIALALKKVEPNVKKIVEHRQKYERLRKERDLRKAELYKQRNQKKDEVLDVASALNEGNVIGLHSITEYETKFKAASSLSPLVILYFTAKWSGACRYGSPLYENLAKKHPKSVFFKIDIDELSMLALGWNITDIPTFCFIKNGKEIDRMAGVDKKGLERKVSELS